MVSAEQIPAYVAPLRANPSREIAFHVIVSPRGHVMPAFYRARAARKRVLRGKKLIFLDVNISENCEQTTATVDIVVVVVVVLSRARQRRIYLQITAWKFPVALTTP